MDEYTKIQTLFKRDRENIIISVTKIKTEDFRKYKATHSKT